MRRNKVQNKNKHKNGLLNKSYHVIYEECFLIISLSATVIEQWATHFQGNIR